MPCNLFPIHLNASVLHFAWTTNNGIRGGCPIFSAVSKLADIRIVSRKQPKRTYRAQLDDSKFLRLKFENDLVSLQSARIAFKPIENELQISNCNSSPRKLLLVSVVHVAQKDYYDDIAQTLDAFDHAFLELITSDENCFRDEQYRRRIKSEKSSLFVAQKSLEMMYRSHNLVTQVRAMDFTKPNIQIADLPSEAIENLKLNVNLNFKIERRKADPNLDWESLLPLQAGRRLLKLMTCLVPCPELGLLILDWSFARQGIISPILRPLVQCVMRLDLVGARRLVLAQTLVSAQAWQNKTRRNLTNNKVIIQERNKHALEQVFTQSENQSTSALVYGALHMPDMVYRLKNDWKMQISAKSWHTAWSVKVSSNDAPSKRNFTSAVMIFITYLGIAGIDWVTLVRSLLETLTAVDAQGLPQEISVEIIFYSIRHIIFYVVLDRLLIQWDEKLFENILFLKTKKMN